MTISGEVVASGGGLAAPHAHSVQFYEDDAYLHDVVADFIAAGVIGFEPAVVFATPQHRDGFAQRLAAKGFDVEELHREGHLRFFDARETLARFMNGRVPDREKCRTAVHEIVGAGSDGRPQSRLRVYGEMVDVLWREGAAEGAIRLENIWNELAAESNFLLLCGYRIGNFYKPSHAEDFEAICDAHDVVAPTEALDGGDRDVLLRQIAELQQRAQALKTEIDNRTTLEHALREALNERWDAEDAQAQLQEERFFLLDATTLLHQSLDYESRLGELTQLLVPHLADWCAVDIAGDDGSRERVATAGTAPSSGEELVAPMIAGSRVLGTITLRGHRASAELANELAQRAAIAIENSRLYAHAQEGSRAKDDFLATLSHELRTPLTAILGWARMLRLGPLDAETTATALETIEHSATAQAALIDDLLDLSKAVRGKVTLHMNRVDLVPITVAAIDALRVAAAAKRVRIELHRPEGPVFVNGDAARLQQVAWNLLSNAIKFSQPDGVVTVEIGTEGVLIVRDEGRGVRAEFLPHVFEAFRQSESPANRSYGGLGMGLAIVKNLVELHGGTITADSAGEGRGATFTVRVPSSP